MAETDASGRFAAQSESEVHMAPKPPPRCPHCGSTKLSFAEHLTTVTVYQCEDCGRAVSVTTTSAQTK